MTRRITGSSLGWLLPAAVIVLTCGVLGLAEPTETRYAEIGREMVSSGDWLVPRLNGVTHLQKPPLAYWAIGGGIALFGANEWGARMAGALAAGLLLWCVAAISSTFDRRGNGGTHVPLAPLLLASCPLFFALSQRLAADMFLAAAVGVFWVATLRAETRGGVLPHLALAAGFLAKGPVVLIHTAIPLLIAAAWSRDRSILRPLLEVRGWVVFAALALPWYILLAARTPGLLDYWITDQIWNRYTTTVHHRPGPWYYFLIVAAAGALPWTAAAAVGGWRGSREARSGLRANRLAVVCWAAIPTAFFSTSGSKLPAYVLPEIAAMALLAAWAFEASPRNLPRWSGATLLVLAAALELAAPRALAQAVGVRYAETVPIPAAAHAAAAVFTVAGLALLALRPAAGAAAVLAGWLLLSAAILPIEGVLGSPRPLARFLARARAPGDVVFEYRTFNAGLPFYLRERIPMIEVPRDAGFDSEPALRAAMPSMQEARALAGKHARVWALTPRGQGAALADSLERRIEQTVSWHGHDLVLLVPMG